MVVPCLVTSPAPAVASFPQHSLRPGRPAQPLTSVKLAVCLFEPIDTCTPTDYWTRLSLKHYLVFSSFLLFNCICMMHTHIHSHILMLTHIPAHVPQHACKGQRTTLGITLRMAVFCDLPGSHLTNPTFFFFFSLMFSVKIPSLGV